MSFAHFIKIKWAVGVCLKANRHSPKGIKGENETSPISSNFVIQERSALYYNVIACSIYSIYGFMFSILL